MVGAKWKETLVAALLCGGLVWGQQPPSSPPVGEARSDNVITVRTAGKPDRKCKVLNKYQRADGKTVYEVEAIDNRERMTIVEAKTEPKGNSGPWYSMFHGTPQADSPYAQADWQASMNRSAPPAKADPVGPATASTRTAQTIPQASAGSIVPMANNQPTDAGKDARPAPFLPPTHAEPAPASDWRESWGMAADHKSEAVTHQVLPQADSTRQDPLMDPEWMTHKQGLTKMDEAGSASKGTPTVIPSSVQPANPGSTMPVPMSANHFGAMGSGSGLNPADTVMPMEEPTPDQKSHSLGDMIRKAFNRDEAKANPCGASTPCAAGACATCSECSDGSGIKALPASGAAIKPVLSESFVAGPNSVPLGAQSVLAAGSGAGNTVYVPVPVATVPDLTRKPVSPVPALPPAPNPLAGNPALANRLAATGMPSIDPSAGPTTGNAFGAQPNPQAVLLANAFDAGPASPQGPTSMPAGYPGPVPQPGAPQAGAYAGQNYPAPPGAYVLNGSLYAQPGMAGNAAQTLVMADTRQMLMVLHDSPYPSQREWVVESLAGADYRRDGTIVPALLKAAREDPAASVRCACIRTLVKMNVYNNLVLATLEALKSDPNANVRNEATLALANFGPIPTAVAPGGIHPAGAVMPGRSY